MRFLALYGPSLVMVIWAALIVVIGRSDLLGICGLTAMAVALWLHGIRSSRDWRRS